ncbi:MAG TPA: HAD hydrolase-like protein, partial [Candidatus Marinimicrobia bacterium]|nr:HAD hydrolase-like protein [Candidatus Neomarinimicrobiota bacterium]
MAIKAVIFDFDGVVINSEPLYMVAERRLFDQYGIKVPDEDWKYFKGTTENDFYQLIMAKYQIKTDAHKLIEDGRRYIKEEFNKGVDYLPGFL